MSSSISTSMMTMNQMALRNRPCLLHEMLHDDFAYEFGVDGSCGRRNRQVILTDLAEEPRAVHQGIWTGI